MKIDALTSVRHEEILTLHKANVKRRNSRALPKNIIIYVLMTGLALLFMLPIFWMASTSLKLPTEVFAFPMEWLPSKPQWGNYEEAFNKFPLWRFMWNSTYMVVLSTIGQLVSVPLIAYGFARFEFPGKNVLFILMLATLMIPTHIKFIPLYWMFQQLGLIGTYWPIILPEFFGHPFFIFLMTQYMRSIPKELDEAARLDGAGSFTILYRIILPLCKPVLAVIVVFSFLWNWNEFMAPLIFLDDFEEYPISVGLAFFQGRYSVEWHLFMAATLVSIIPVLVLYFFAQRHLIGGLSAIGVKG